MEPKNPSEPHDSRRGDEDAPGWSSALDGTPQVSAETFRAAEALFQVKLEASERQRAAAQWRGALGSLLGRRCGPQTVRLTEQETPATQWIPARFRKEQGRSRRHFRRIRKSERPLPECDAEIAFSPLSQLSDWLERRQLTSSRLTRIYLDRLERYGPVLNCVITVTADRALAQAARVDEEIAEGRYRGPLHGIPWGAKDLIDTAGTPTTYGAEMFRGRVPATNAAVVRMLEEAGAVLLAKLSLGALGLGNDWYGGETLNPWVIEERSSGSSSGSAAATAAGLVGFSLGTETLGSIVHPAYRCGCVGLRPTFGRVPRDGTMTLAWSLDKIGPLTRGVEDTMLVLQAIAGDTAEDSGIGAVPLAFTARRSVRGRRVGIVPQWMREAPATSHDLAVLEQLETLGLKPVELAFPEFPYQSLALIMFAEAAASLEPWLLNDSLRRVPREAVDGWPLLLKQARFLSAVDLIQAERLRTRIAAEFVRAFDAVDVMLVPSLRSEAIIATNFTGHPAITLPAGFIEISEARTDWAPHREAPRLPLEHPRKVPHGVTLIGRLFEEGALAEVAMALEGALRLGVLKPPSCQA